VSLAHASVSGKTTGRWPVDSSQLEAAATAAQGFALSRRDSVRDSIPEQKCARIYSQHVLMLVTDWLTCAASASSGYMVLIAVRRG